MKRTANVLCIVCVLTGVTFYTWRSCGNQLEYWLRNGYDVRMTLVENLADYYDNEKTQETQAWNAIVEQRSKATREYLATRK